jgi:galactokinase
MNVGVNGNIPPASGLSNSGAFVAASSLVVLLANGIKEIKNIDLAEMAIESERAIGFNGRG